MKLYSSYIRSLLYTIDPYFRNPEFGVHEFIIQPERTYFAMTDLEITQVETLEELLALKPKYIVVKKNKEIGYIHLHKVYSQKSDLIKVLDFTDASKTKEYLSLGPILNTLTVTMKFLNVKSLPIGK